VISGVRHIGEGGRHISFSADGLRCVRFGASEDDFARIINGARLSLAGRLDSNTWNGVTNAQLVVDSVAAGDLFAI
jgi:hypothetical protein